MLLQTGAVQKACVVHLVQFQQCVFRTAQARQARTKFRFAGAQFDCKNRCGMVSLRSFALPLAVRNLSPAQAGVNIVPL